jgi:hypothetical protein
MSPESKVVNINLSFEKTHLPPFEDILIIGTECSLGMNGVGKCLDLLVPDGFSYHIVDDSNVAAVVINKNIIKRVPEDQILGLLQQKVFPYVGRDELIKVIFEMSISYEGIVLDTI